MAILTEEELLPEQVTTAEYQRRLHIAARKYRDARMALRDCEGAYGGLDTLCDEALDDLADVAVLRELPAQLGDVERMRKLILHATQGAALSPAVDASAFAAISDHSHRLMLLLDEGRSADAVQYLYNVAARVTYVDVAQWARQVISGF